MMIEKLQKFFTEYAGTFRSGVPEIDRNIRLKLDHSLRVLAETRSLCAAEPAAAALSTAAEYAALFHDLSRFEQFTRFRSFNDAESFDHGDRSAELIAELKLLDFMPEPERVHVLAAVRVHNKAVVPSDLSEPGAQLARIVRDADKLDILRVLAEFLAAPPEENSAVVFSLSAAPELTPAIREQLFAGRPARHADMRTAVDFLAAKFQWSKELNFAWSRAEFRRRGYPELLRGHLPDTPDIRELYRRCAAASER